MPPTEILTTYKRINTKTLFIFLEWVLKAYCGGNEMSM